MAMPAMCKGGAMVAVFLVAVNYIHRGSTVLLLMFCCVCAVFPPVVMDRLDRKYPPIRVSGSLCCLIHECHCVMCLTCMSHVCHMNVTCMSHVCHM